MQEGGASDGEESEHDDAGDEFADGFLALGRAALNSGWIQEISVCVCVRGGGFVRNCPLI